ncbi:HET-domain-containing protein [Microthyrium microscopicum]|uniref:HET-domain-containing protein n=1 Tax=Microthyrium microscopicum TaxID=703497 RepID=A0A6A6U4X5_9PEZI|nr:HET-domain-containing protein [Microthyrium microscopicum]
MRLINLLSFEIEEFFGDKVPPYIALSHTWSEGQEPVFKEWSKALRKVRKNADHNMSTDEIKMGLHLVFVELGKNLGFQKILSFLEIVKERGVEYGWADTICIDKTSSAELSEAINSMFAIYRNCSLCIAYLADVQGGDLSAFRASRWFTRGWTLQELIAPQKVYFYDQRWVEMGEKGDRHSSIYETVVRASRVGHTVLERPDTIRNHSIAQKMSWASRRTTTRREDIAYCLLGLFEVNMPLLYGEGMNAFQRLQEEILKKSDDDSIFAWYDPEASFFTYRGLLARSPAEFANSGEIQFNGSDHSEPLWITNKGIRVQFNGFEKSKPNSRNSDFFVVLDCRKNFQERLAIKLIRLSPEGSQYARVDCHQLDSYTCWQNQAYSSWEQEKRIVQVRNQLIIPADHSSPRIRGFLYDLQPGAQTAWQAFSTGTDVRKQASQIVLRFPQPKLSKPSQPGLEPSKLAPLLCCRFRVRSGAIQRIDQYEFNPSEDTGALGVDTTLKLTPLESKGTSCMFFDTPIDINLSDPALISNRGVFELRIGRTLIQDEIWFRWE